MSQRELVVLGTASQVPTKHRNHNGYLLRWDGTGFLFDPGEGTQRQMTLAGARAHEIHHLCLTHFHGDHCLGVPGVLQRMSLDGVARPVHAHYPARGEEHFHHLRRASVSSDGLDLHQHPIRQDGVVASGPFGTLHARRLDHRIETFGYRLVEPDGRRILPEELARHGISGPQVGQLQRAGRLQLPRGVVELAEVSAHRPGQKAAFIMDTRLCDGVFALAEGVDLLVVESTFLDQDAHLAEEYRHLTAAQAARVAAECRVGALVLTHFSQRYEDPARFAAEAAAVFDGPVHVAEDLARVPLPPRRRP
ncbi:ribonuclease Z [Salinifilum ghardaiensis]